MNQKNLNRKLALAGLLVALAVLLSVVSVPVGVAKVAPFQHLINVVSAVLLGPVYAVGVAFLASLIRYTTGLGSLLAFPGSMIGALLAGLLYRLLRSKCQRQSKGKGVSLSALAGACVGEVFGTAVLGGLLAFPIATALMGSKATVVTFFVLPFFYSTLTGAVLAFALLFVLRGQRFLNLDEEH